MIKDPFFCCRLGHFELTVNTRGVITAGVFRIFCPFKKFPIGKDLI